MQLPLEAGAPCSPGGQGATPAEGSAALGTCAGKRRSSWHEASKPAGLTIKNRITCPGIPPLGIYQVKMKTHIQSKEHLYTLQSPQ